LPSGYGCTHYEAPAPYRADAAADAKLPDADAPLVQIGQGVRTSHIKPSDL